MRAQQQQEGGNGEVNLKEVSSFQFRASTAKARRRSKYRTEATEAWNGATSASFWMLVYFEGAKTLMGDEDSNSTK
jgi:hypothetical protein